MGHLADFASKLISRHLVIAFLVVDAIGFLLLGRQIPTFVFPLSLAVGLLVGSYQVFAEQRAKNEELLAQIARITSLQPQLSLGFQVQGRPQPMVKIELRPLPEEPDYDSLVRTKEHDLLARAGPPDEIAAVGLPRTLGALLAPGREAYETAVATYLRVYRHYLETNFAHELYRDRLRPVSIMVTNSGGSPAVKVTIEIGLPEADLFPSEDDVLWHFASRDSDPPSPPEEPRVGISYVESVLGGLSALAYMSPHAKVEEEISPANTEGPRYQQDEGLIRYFAREILHNVPERDFEDFLLYLGDITVDTTLTLPVRILVGNMPDPITQTLTVHMAVQSSSHTSAT